MAKLLAGSILNLYFLFGPFVKKYSDSNVERLLCITDYRDVTFQCGTSMNEDLIIRMEPLICILFCESDM